MSYALQTSYFTDYWWKDEGEHPTRAPLAPTNPLDPYCDWQYWFDRVNVEDFRWYTADLKASTKFYAVEEHEYTTTNKMGLFCYSGPLWGTGDVVQIVESAHEEPYPPTGPVRPGFTGQYGAATAIGYTGTIYDIAVGHINDATIDPPPATHSHGPFGITLYASAGVAGTTDGIQVIFVPKDSWLTIQDYAAAWQTINGPAIVVAVGKLRDAGAGNLPTLTLVTTFTTYADGTSILINPSVEYFCRLEYFPEQAPFKNMGGAVDNDSNYDRRLFIWFGSDKKRKKIVGMAQLTEYTYTAASNFIQLFCYDKWFDGEQTWDDYTDGYIQFDEIEVTSEFLPCSGMDIWLKHSDQSYAQFYYQKETNELTHDAASTTLNVPTILMNKDVRVLSICNNNQPTHLYLYASDFIPAFADGWTVTSTTGTWTNSVTPITGFRDNFKNVYTNKGRDPNYTVASGLWDTSTNPGYLHGQYVVLGANQNMYIVGDKNTGGDFVFTTNITISGLQASKNFHWYFGLSAAYGFIDGSLRLRWQEASGWTISYRHTGAWTDVIVNTLSPLDVEREVRFMRVGCLIKLYVDGTLVSSLATEDLTAATGYVYVRLYNSTVDMDTINIQSIFPNSYAYMYNNAPSTAVSGNIYRSIANNQDTGHCEVLFWEDFASGTADAEARVKLHWDNGGAGTNWLGIRLGYVGATGVKTLYLHDTEASFIAINFPANAEPVINGYTQHAYRIWWATDGAGNIIQVAVYNASDGELLGSALCTHAYPGNMRLEHLTLTVNGTEQAYFGSVFVFEDPLPVMDVVETLAFHGQVRRITPQDDKGIIVLTAYGMTYPALMVPIYNPDTTVHDTEVFVTDATLLQHYLPSATYNPYWKWWHPWNADIASLPGTWIGHRARGKNMFDVMSNLASYSGLRFQSTPEQQFIFRKYYRNFITADVLELGNTLPEGIFLTSDPTYINKNETNFIIKCQRIDDATLNARVGNLTGQAASFQQPFVPADLVRNGGVYQPPTMTNHAPVNRVGNLGVDVGNAGIDIVGSTLGSMGPPGAGVSSPTNMLNSWTQAVLTSKSHKNQVYLVGLFASKPWLRPMDIIQMRIDTLNPDINTVAANIVDKYIYVIQMVHHKSETTNYLTQDTVEYTIGRIEDDTELGNVVDGFGEVSSPDVTDKLKFGLTKDARSMTLQ